MPNNAVVTPPPSRPSVDTVQTRFDETEDAYAADDSPAAEPFVIAEEITDEPITNEKVPLKSAFEEEEKKSRQPTANKSKQDNSHKNKRSNTQKPSKTTTSIPNTYRTTTTTTPDGRTVTTTTSSNNSNSNTNIPSDVAYIDEDNTIINSDNSTIGTVTPPVQNDDGLSTPDLLDSAKSNDATKNIVDDQQSFTDLAGNDISECISNLNSKGLAAWDTLPEIMYVGYDYQFQVLIDHLSQGSEVLSQAAGKEIDIEDVKVSEYGETTIAGHRAQIITIGDEIKLKLQSLNKDAFSIHLLPDVKAIQKIDCDGAANWKWNIKPLKKGKYSLQMQMSLKNKRGDFEFFNSFTRKIDVKVEEPWFASWYIYALIGLGIASIAYLIYVFKKTKSSNVPEVAMATTFGIANTSIPVQSTNTQSIIPKPNPATLPHKVFLSYSHKDEEFKEKLDTHLSALKQTNIIDVWNDRQIPLGSEWDVEIKRELEESDVILLMISADFLASSYISEIEIPAAIARHDEGSAIVIPIFIRPCDWRGLPFEKLQGLPQNAKPLTTFDDIDVGLTEIAAGIRNRVS